MPAFMPSPFANRTPRFGKSKRPSTAFLYRQQMVLRLAQAVNSGLAMFLYGAPGNGKTIIASRLTRAFGEAIWIPRALNVGGSIVRLYDPNNHEPLPLPSEKLSCLSDIDERWIRIRRPTLVVGGELDA